MSSYFSFHIFRPYLLINGSGEVFSLLILLRVGGDDEGRSADLAEGSGGDESRSFLSLSLNRLTVFLSVSLSFSCSSCVFHHYFKATTLAAFSI